MNLQSAFNETNQPSEFKQALEDIISGVSSRVKSGIEAISKFYTTSDLARISEGTDLLGLIQQQSEKTQKMVVSIVVMTFRTNKELPGNLEYWAINKVPEFNRWTLKAMEMRQGFFQPRKLEAA